ncbi:MAG: type II toxin-antitoxin system RelE/ParE family toxin [Nitrospirae bacterium]|nr:type II toxin-antitoxin system RelE/ParE family toxin [Nitrospirota bacterium]
MAKTIIFYRTTEGKCPVKEFLDSLSAKAAQKTTWVLSLIEELDIVPASYFKKLISTENIWECRIQSGSNAYRIFCFFDGSSVVVLTHGMIKKTQKTPQREIERAEAYRKDYSQRRVRK